MLHLVMVLLTGGMYDKRAVSHQTMFLSLAATVLWHDYGRQHVAHQPLTQAVGYHQNAAHIHRHTSRHQLLTQHSAAPSVTAGATCQGLSQPESH
jgi:hypothetical protein